MDSNQEFSLYKDMKARTNGEIYIGVVGPVRTGKSTFIKRFMDLCVLPQMENEHVRARAKDELPQSAAGTTIMTTEPKFIPSEAALIYPMEDVGVKVRLIDCVGFMVEGASGHVENEKERMVKTPWSQTEIPFTKAAEIGTKKVIAEHSTIGIVVTTDGSFSEIPRQNYVPAEERTIQELSAIKKPFLVLLNSVKPYSKETGQLAEELTQKYGVTVLPVNCDQLKKEDITAILENVLLEFPVTELDFYTPQWMEMLPEDHWLKAELIAKAAEVLEPVGKIRDVKKNFVQVTGESLSGITVSDIQMSDGRVRLEVQMKPQVYYDILSELTGTAIHNEYELIHMIRELSAKKKEFDSVGNALSEVSASGFGVVTPVREEIVLDEPEVIKNGTKYGVKIKAQVPSVNMIKTNISVEIAPIVGTKNQADDLIAYIKENAGDNAQDCR